jgi:uncharacterized phage infection (PIP) family protein YhgE
MFRARFLRSAAVALVVYGALGLVITLAMLVVGISTFGQVALLRSNLDSERLALVQSMRTVSATLRDTSGATGDFQRSIENARGAADRASELANNSAGTFRQLGDDLGAITILGVAPLASAQPQLDQTADQLQQLAITMGSTRDALAQNRADVGRVGADLSLLQAQLDAMASTLNQPGILGLDPQAMLPFQVAFYAMCLLVILQSVFAIVAGIALYRLQRALGATEPLFQFDNWRSGLRTATTTDGDAHDRVRTS